MKHNILLLLIFSCIVSSKAQTRKDSLYVFVGEKIKIEEIPYKIDTLPDGRVSMPMDTGFNCEYKIIENVYGNYPSDTIKFRAYDHYGVPAFSRYDNVMLFVSISPDGTLYHQKYQYFNLYKTKDGKWASPYSAYDYNHTYLKYETDIKPERIKFESSVSYDISKMKESDIKYWFPRKYYLIKKGKAYPKYGNYIPELFELKKRGILLARGIFFEKYKD
ncbi:MAG: hypothetical protein ACK5MK_08245 [Dysgonomonas sp.]